MIELRNLTLAYGDRRLLDGVTAVIPAAEVTALVGRNGTGKSTLLRAVAGTDTRTLAGGEILIDGRDASRLTPMQRARTVAVVTTDKCRVANLRVEDAVALGRSPYTNWIGRMQRDDRETVRRALDTVGMEPFSDKSMDSLSDGEAQRVMIARALAQQTPVILLDEPTAFLDMPGRYELCSLLRTLARDEGKCIFFSTHELDIALSLCDRTAIIDTPSLHVAPSAEIAGSGLVERLFRSDSVSFDPATLGVRFKN